MGRSIIIIAGMSRGGTNLLWNIVQSHPSIIDTCYELNEIFGGKTKISLLEKALIELEALSHVPIPVVCKIVKERLAHFSKKSFEEDLFNCEKFPGVFYEEKDFESLTICTKLVSSWEIDPARRFLKRNNALKYIPLLERAFHKPKVIFLVRNGLAVAEGWSRRGADIQTAALWYGHYIRHYESYVRKNPNQSIIVRFEDLLTNPFGAAERLYDFLDLIDKGLEHLRIAIKPTIRSNHDVINATEKEKVWISRGNWRQYLDVEINNAQIDKLSLTDQMRFISMNKVIMERYEYF